APSGTCAHTRPGSSGEPQLSRRAHAPVAAARSGCAQHCGTNHYKMKGMLDVMTEDDFAKWSNEASLSGVRGYDPNDKNSHWGWDWRAN
ncbi:MAG: hypothetical protein WKG00_39330, partial [Polyangiaceae bacterium]